MKMKTIKELAPQAYTKEVRELLRSPEPSRSLRKSSTKIFTKGNKNYDLELDKIISKIKKAKAKLVLLQFPDGLKPYATSVVDYLEENTNAKFLIWFGDCFGACDTPTGLENIKPKIDLVIQFGHSEMMPDY